MEKLIATFEDYSIFKADAKCINELSQFIVVENYKHHVGTVEASQIADDIADVTKEELELYGDNTYIYIARDNQGKMLGSIRVFLWNRQSELPLEKIYGINPLEAIHSDVKFNYWHVGRFAIDSTSGISTFTLFKRLMALAIQPIVGDSDSYMIAEIDSKLLKVMNALGFVTNQLGDSIYYLTSETVPISSSKQGIMGFYSKYGCLCGVAWLHKGVKIIVKRYLLPKRVKTKCKIDSTFAPSKEIIESTILYNRPYW